MNKTWGKVASVMLAGALAATVGCAKEEKGSESTSPTVSPEAGVEAKPEPINIRMVAGDNNANWDNMDSDIGKYIKEKTGVTLKIDFPIGGNDTDLFALMAASNEYPDLVMPKGSANKLVDAGALLDLTDLIEEHAPNIKKVYGDYMKRLRWSSEDHSIYILPLHGVDHEYFDAGGGFQIQHQVLKELGYPQIKTVKEYEEALKAYVAKHPTTEDGKPTIPLSLNAGEWQFVISTTNPAFYTTGAPDDGEFYIDQATFEAKLHYQRPEEREYFRWLNHMNSMGLLDPESFVQKYDQYKAKIASGRVLGMIDQHWDYQEAENVLKQDGKFDKTYARLPVTMSEDIKEASFMDFGYLAGWGIGITKSAKDPVAIIKFLDYLASDEGQILKNWGIEGKHYKVENGVRVIPEDVQKMKANDGNTFKKATGIGNYNIAPAYGDGVKDPTGNYYTTTFPEQIQLNYSDADKETLKAYGKTYYKDFWPSKDEFPVRPYGAAFQIPFETGSDANVIFEKAQDIVKKRIPEAILAKPEQFDAIYDAFLKDLEKVGVAKLNAEFTNMVKERVKLWNE